MNSVRPPALLALESAFDAHITLSRIRKHEPLLIAERFRLIEVLGSGGFGVVVHAHDLRLRREVALKCVPAADPFAMRDHLASEACVQTKVRAREVVVVYDFFAARIQSSRGPLGFVAIVMEYIEARNLRDWARGRPSVAQRVAVLLSAARGLEAAHAVGVVHRDVKPENVLVTQEQEARLVDFGLAYQYGHRGGQSALARRGTFGVGTPEYMAPELREGKFGPAADQYAFAITAWELLTGTRPFSSCQAEPARAGRIRAYAGVEKLPPGLAHALGRALCPASEARFPSLRQLRQALERPSSTPESPGSTLERVLGLAAGTAAVGALAAAAYRARKKHDDEG